VSDKGGKLVDGIVWKPAAGSSFIGGVAVEAWGSGANERNYARRVDGVVFVRNRWSLESGWDRLVEVS
jgi:hypothetical protein